MRIGIIAALNGELQPLVRGWESLAVARGAGLRMWQHSVADAELVAVCAGMGAAAVRRAFTAAEHAGALDQVLSVGWAGALTERCLAGECFAVGQVVDALTGERFDLAQQGQVLVTTSRVADKAEKRRLAMAYGATLVDMEAATVARLAQMRQIPFACFKAVSDGVDLNLPDMNPFIDVHGKLEMTGFLASVAVRPQLWGDLLQLGRNSSKAARHLAAAVNAHLQPGTSTGALR